MAPFSSSPDPLARENYRPSLPDFLVALLFVKSKPRGLSSRGTFVTEVLLACPIANDI